MNLLSVDITVCQSVLTCKFSFLLFIRNDLKIAVANSSFVIEVHTNTSSFKSSEAIRVSLTHKTSVFTYNNKCL